MKKIGLALGGGGAKGFAHLPVLEVFDELNIKPYCISGTSIGAILGALYASGMSANEIYDLIGRVIVSPKDFVKKNFEKRNALKIFELFDPNFKPGGFLKGDKFLSFLYENMKVKTFNELKIPFKTVATDFWRRQAVVLDSGDLLTAIRASMAIPYIFTPVIQEDRILVDGGLVNNLPLDLLDPSCDITIAVDIAGDVTTPRTKLPSPVEAMFYSYEVMMKATSHEKHRRIPVDIYIEPPIKDISLLDFHKAEAIYEQGLASKETFKKQLNDLLNKKGGLNFFQRRSKRG